MRIKPIIFFLIVGSLAGYFVYREATGTGKSGVVNIGSQAPDFSLKDENGKEVKLSDYRGKLVFLNFWATWCEPCIEEMPEMEMLKNRLKDRKFQMLAVSVDLDWDPIKQFYKKYNLTIPTALDPGGVQVAKGIYKVTGWPETFLIDANGYVVKHTWRERWTDPRVIAYLESLIPKEQAQKVSD